MPIVTSGGVTSTTAVEVIIIMHQCAYYSKVNIIHSSGQVDHYKIFVDDKSIKIGGKQHVLNNYNQMIPITIKNDLPCMFLCPHMEQELLTLPCAALTSDVDWGPTCLDSPGSIGNEIWYDTKSSIH